jgi:hypothetical protein
MWSYSLPPKNQPGYTVAHLQQLGDFISKHRYIVAMICLFVVASTIAAMLAQKSVAHLDTNIQTITADQQAASLNTTPIVPQPSTAPVTSDAQNSNSSSTESNSDNGKTSLTVNNQQIPVPANGSVHRTVPSSDGNANVNVSVNSSSTNNGTDSSSSSTSIQLNTSSESRVDNSE